MVSISEELDFFNSQKQLYQIISLRQLIYPECNLYNENKNHPDELIL